MSFWSGTRPAAARLLNGSIGAPEPIYGVDTAPKGASKTASAGRFDIPTLSTVVRVSRQRCLCAYSTVITPSPHFCGEGGELLCFCPRADPAAYRKFGPNPKARSDLPPPACFSVGKKSRTNGAVRSCDLWPKTFLPWGSAGRRPVRARTRTHARPRLPVVTRKFQAQNQPFFWLFPVFSIGEIFTHQTVPAVLHPCPMNFSGVGDGWAVGPAHVRTGARSCACVRVRSLPAGCPRRKRRFPVKFPAPLPGSAARPGQ